MIQATQAVLAWTAANGPGQTAIDGLAIGTLVAALASWLPPIAAGFTIVWTAIRIYETDTVQRFIKRFKRGDKD